MALALVLSWKENRRPNPSTAEICGTRPPTFLLGEIGGSITQPLPKPLKPIDLT